MTKEKYEYLEEIQKEDLEEYLNDVLFTEDSALATDEKPLDEMNILEMVDYFIEQGMTEEQASDLAHAEWQARTINDM